MNDDSNPVPQQREPHAAPQQPALPQPIGELFIQAGLMTPEQVKEVLELQRKTQLRFGQAAIQLGFVSQQDVQAVLSRHFNYPTTLTEQEGPIRRLAIANAPFSPEAEAIRRIRSNLTVLFNEQASMAFAVVSPRAGEGKSYLSASLALAFSQTGIRTLLVNANLRSAGQVGIGDLRGRRDIGLSTMLSGRTPVSVEQPLASFPNLYLLDAGPQPPNPLEILSEPNLRKFLQPLREQYYVIVVDTPPGLESSDAQVIARQLDGCLMVARKDMTWLSDLRQLEHMMLAAGVRVLGTVYNAAPLKPSGRQQPSEARSRQATLQTA